MDNVRMVKFEDSDGQFMPMLAVGDVMVPPLPGIQDHLGELRDFKFKDGDVILTTYPRSGTHFMWEILRMLKQGSAEYYEGEKESEFLEMFYGNGLAQKTDRVVNTHFPPELLPVDYKNRKCKFVHVFRNPKDVMVSLYNHWINAKEFLGYDGKFPAFFELAMKGQVESGKWFDYELKFEEFFKSNPDIPALILSFEDLKSDPVANIRKVSDFLGLPRDEKLVTAIADAVSFKKMKAAKLELKSGVFNDESMLKAMNNPSEEAMKELANKMYRKGEAGDWKNWFTVAQNERYDAEFETRMKDSSLKYKIKWQV